MATNESDRDTAGDEGVSALFSQTGVAEVWASGAAARGRSFGAATALMVDMADVKPGDRVLDIAAGTGEQTLVAARRVGPSGSVLATDVAGGMLEIAAEELRKAGLTNVETRVMDAQHLELESDSFDAVISRMGIMLIPDRDRALAEIKRVLKPGGRLAAIVWSTPERNLGTIIPAQVARRHAGLDRHVQLREPPAVPPRPHQLTHGACTIAHAVNLSTPPPPRPRAATAPNANENRTRRRTHGPTTS